MEEKFILDACCGGRMFWFNKHQPNTIYIDNNPRAKETSKLQPNFSCEPDVIMDFTDLKFPDKQFKMVVFDPPHIRGLNNTSISAIKFGILNKETWQRKEPPTKAGWLLRTSRPMQGKTNEGV